MSDDNLKKASLEWIKSKLGKMELLKLFASSDKYISEDNPMTLFMAGSPGAGKTEISTNLIKEFGQKPVRIDADEIRARCPGYNGKNSSLFQECATKGVNVLFDHCLDSKYSVIMDATFAYEKATMNIERSLAKGRVVIIWFVYQDPLQAWKITKAREAQEGRHVPIEVFINAYFKSQSNVNAAKEKFGNQIRINFLLKNFEGRGLEKLEVNIDRVDSYIPTRYTEDTLRMALESVVL